MTPDEYEKRYGHLRTKSGMMRLGPESWSGSYRPASDLTAAQIVQWIANQLEEIPNREFHVWQVHLSPMAYGMIKERYWEAITLEKFCEWMTIGSDSEDGETLWEVRLELAGTIGDHDDFYTDKIADKVEILLQIAHEDSYYHQYEYYED